MAETSKQKSNKYLFVLEDGEISDTDDEEDKNTKRAKKERDSKLIEEWAGRKKPYYDLVSSDSNDAMDIASDEEDGGKHSKIDTKPVAMTIAFLDEKFAMKNKGVVESQMVMKFGPDWVDSNDGCIFVLIPAISSELTKAVEAPLGVMTVVFHDQKFCDDVRDYMVQLCNKLFGSSKVMAQDTWFIEVVQNSFLDFEIDNMPCTRNPQILYTKPQEVQNPSNKNFSQTCFNCLGSHALRDCSRPKDYTVINKNRQEFLASKHKIGRYHKETEKYSEFLPGVISLPLRKALGLKKNQLPLHVYRMRQFGYPPGWLEEAKIPHSGVTVYGKWGVVPEDGDEDGEIFEKGSKDLFDRRKLITFPGFNAPAPEDTLEEHEKHNCPSLTEDLLLESMVERMAPNLMQAYKKKKVNLLDDDSESGIASPSTSTQNSHDSQDSNLMTPKQSSSGLSCSEPLTPDQALVRTASKDFGTPVLASHSRFANLPDRGKFSVDISDVINFENLPDSTGTYERMVGFITKIREFKKNE